MIKLKSLISENSESLRALCPNPGQYKFTVKTKFHGDIDIEEIESPIDVTEDDLDNYGDELAARWLNTAKIKLKNNEPVSHYVSGDIIQVKDVKQV